jgi:hypothetical protein
MAQSFWCRIAHTPPRRGGGAAEAEDDSLIPLQGRGRDARASTQHRVVQLAGTRAQHRVLGHGRLDQARDEQMVASMGQDGRWSSRFRTGRRRLEHQGQTPEHSDNVGVHGAKARAEGLGSDGDVDDDVDDEDDGLEDREEVDQAEYGEDRKAHSQRDRQAGVEGQQKPVLRREHEAGGRVSRVWRRENGPREEGGDREWDRNREQEGSHGRSGCGRADGDGTGVQGADGDEVGVRDEGTDMDTDMELGDGPGPPDEYAVTEERLRSLMGAL